MASCSTPRWVSTSPYVKLTVTESSSTATTATLSWTLQYISSSAANTSVNKSYTVKIAGSTVKTGTYDIDGKTGTHTIASGTKTITKTTSTQTISFNVSFAFNLTWSGTYGGTKSASGSISVAKKTSYAVKYNANGGSGAPSAQTKWHGTNLTLSSTKPTRTGYTFQGWGTTSSDTSVNYAPGDSYTTNAAITLYAIWRANTYAVKYNANGGSGAPSSQTKTYGVTLTLSSTKPTRTGYAFQGWGTSTSDTTVDYAAGASYTTNKAITLYAIWKANTYTVKYNANGGSGAPSSQTKTYGVTLTLSSTVPTRTNYTFKGWGTSASASTVSYAAGGSYTANKAITLYAVWELNYVKPRVYNVKAERCTSAGVLKDDGWYALVTCDWECDKTVSSIVIEWKVSTSSTWDSSKTVTASGTSGSVSTTIGSGVLNTEKSYDVRVTVTDSGGSSYGLDTVDSIKFIIDIMDEGAGIGFGTAASIKDTAEFGYHAKFDGDVYGTVMGLNALPEIPENSDFDSYITTGSWAVRTVATSKTIANIPVATAGRLEVSSSTGSGIKDASWSYLTQRFIPYNSATNAIWERNLSRDDTNVWTYGDWFRTTLTKRYSECLYNANRVLWSGGMYMTAGHTAELSGLISDQFHGVVLVFSRYSNGAAQDYHFNTFFISKYQISKHGGCGHTFILSDDGDFSLMACKYLYIHDDKIVGNEINNATGTGASGITYTNNGFVLRYVIGV